MSINHTNSKSKTCTSGIYLQHTYSQQTYKQHKKLFVFFALFISAIFLKYFSVFIPAWGIQLSFVTIPLIISGVYFGPTAGFINGILVDVISFLCFGNAYPLSFLFTLQTGLYGLVSGLTASRIYKSLRTDCECSEKIDYNQHIKKIIKIVLITTVINSFVLGPILVNLYLQNFSINSKLLTNFLLFTRLIKETIKIPITVVFLFLFLKNKEKTWFNK